MRLKTKKVYQTFFQCLAEMEIQHMAKSAGKKKIKKGNNFLENKKGSQWVQ